VTYDQTSRILAITTDLGDNKAVLTELDGEDAISRPFLFRISFATEEPAASVKALLGTGVTLSFGRPGDSDEGPTGMERRPFHGRFSRLSRGVSSRGDAMEWRAEVVPDIWFMSRTTDCCIYQNKTVPEIIEDKLSKHGVSNYELRLTGSYEPVEYCVQYRETTLNFISRLMEQAGISYWHEHEEGLHTLVISDINNNAPLAPWPDLPLGARRDSASIRRLDEEFAVRSHGRALRDYNFEMVDKLPVDVPTTKEVGPAGFSELYDYPGRYQQSGPGRDIAEHQMEADEALHQVMRGESGVAGMNAGMRIKIEDLDDPEVLLTEVRHRGQDFSHWTANMWGRREPAEPSYENSFVCMPKAVPFRPEHAARKPFVQGPQTAIVTGPSGEEVHTDEHGRIKVAFHWDRLDPADDTSSCWLRVSHGWAGSSYGQVHIPRIGHEVIVDFLEGDPDRPIVTGRVYNGNNRHPWALPANKTQSGIKTDSSLGGGGSNEMRFEDKAGSEQVYVHAQKDLDTEVENNETRHVKVDRTTNIDANETLTVGGNKKTDVTGNFDETITGTETRTVTGAVSETFASSETRTIASSQSETIGASITQTVGAGVTQTIGGALTQTVAGGLTFTTPAAVTFTAAGGFTVVAPGGTKTIDSFFKKIGNMNEDGFAFALSVNATKMDINGLAMARVGLKVENVGTAIAQVGANFSKVGIELDQEDLDLRMASSRILRAAMTLVM
jgi:type VI secretion system secreted protein VgrG